ncbi:uncharacterized protein EDB93DRAFT_445871 [Suillus bovinus]|uniref:uncharacterized protein n=1 Tax=Suillus bovinus TaxID=48563 RepID=UPI001B87A220|nr:uncharacterized protein EDB93DRAFT_445871 [Suillus bovinus]KAG2159126.1 hypothetical protein EDB93DRAFT_445871 [Suillus bovinus]
MNIKGLSPKTFNSNTLIECIKALITIDRRWKPKELRYSLLPHTHVNLCHYMAPRSIFAQRPEASVHISLPRTMAPVSSHKKVQRTRAARRTCGYKAPSTGLQRRYCYQGHGWRERSLVERTGYNGSDIMISTSEDGTGPVSKPLWTERAPRQEWRVPAYAL